jgi:hypothetical protein
LTTRETRDIYNHIGSLKSSVKFEKKEELKKIEVSFAKKMKSIKNFNES